MRYLLLLCTAAMFFSCQGQNHHIKGQIEGYPESMVYIAGFNGDQDKIIDSVLTNSSGKFKWDIDTELEPGMYRLMYGNNYFLDILYNNEDISFHTLANAPQKAASFSESKENILLYDYLYKKNKYLNKIDLLEPLIVNYPQDDPFYKDVLKKYEELDTEFKNYISGLTENNPGTMLALYINFDKPLPLNVNIAVEKQEDYIKSNFFKGQVYNDPRLLRLNIIPNKIIGYLSLYRNQNYSKEEQEAEFMVAVDSIIYHMMDNEDIYNFSLQYLIDGFEAFGFDDVVSHIAETYDAVESCVNEKRKSELEKRLENIKKLSTGKTAPDIKLGKDLSLDNINKKYKLVFFWASWCPHCKQLIPQLIDFYNADSKKYDLEIVSVSIDSSQADYQQYLKQFPLPWQHYADFKGWNTQAAIDYSIYATPMLFLLNDQREIIAKPMSIRELKGKLESLKK